MQDELIMQEGMLKKLKNDDKDSDPDAGSGGDQQPGGTLTSCGAPAEVDSGKQLVVYLDSTNVQHVNILKVNRISFMDDRGVVMIMVDANEIENGEFVDHLLTRADCHPV